MVSELYARRSNSCIRVATKAPVVRRMCGAAFVKKAAKAKRLVGMNDPR